MAAPVMAALGFAGTAAALAMARARHHRALRVLLLAFGSAAAVFLSLLLPDFRVLVVVAYAPILLLGAPFGWPGDTRLVDALPWPVINQAVCIAGGLLWAAGVPLGLTGSFYRKGVAVGLWRIGAALATLAFAGSLLSFGLVRPWGEVFPRWVPAVGGRRVPPALVVVPAAIVAVLVTTAGLMFVRFAFSGEFRLGDDPVTLSENWGALLPELLWPLWGPALAAAALAYWYRVRGRCRYCRRG